MLNSYLSRMVLLSVLMAGCSTSSIKVTSDKLEPIPEYSENVPSEMYYEAWSSAQEGWEACLESKKENLENCDKFVVGK